MSVHYDIMGNELKVGDVCAYSLQSGRSVRMGICEIIAVHPDTDNKVKTVHWYRTDGGSTWSGNIKDPVWERNELTYTAKGDIKASYMMTEKLIKCMTIEDKLTAMGL